MRKTLSCLVCGAVMLGAAAGFSACGTEVPRSQYTIRAEYFPETRTLSAQMTADIYNGSETAWETLSFFLYPNAYREGAEYGAVAGAVAPAAYYDGESFGFIGIDSLSGGEYSIAGEDENILSVRLDETLYPGERTEIGISFTVLLANVNHRLGVGEHTVNLSHFYPVLCAYDGGFLEYVCSPYGEPFVNECSDFEVFLTLPQNLTAACAGTVETVTENGKTAYHVIAENVRDTAFVLGAFSVESTSGASPVEYYYFDDSSPAKTLKAAADSLGYFSRLFGDYAYPRYVVVQTDFPYGGMEYAGLSAISVDLREEEIPFVVAHETAHQWWYGFVGSNQFECAWQDEGLAEYSAALFLSAYPEYGGSYAETVAASESAYRTYYAVRSQLAGGADTSMNRPLASFSGEYEYRSIAYDKGVILFDRLRSTYGDRKFFSALETYARRCWGEIAKPEDLIACFPASAEGIFASFLEGRCVI